ncbi:dCTP deaminase [Acidocella sp.]|jgi:dCTP deaminase|uniref:dCTP deaminase n=1 Tax=Acidocella sp. TaxID=50710 RepID=UPI002F41B13C
MQLLNKAEIRRRLSLTNEKGLFIEPLLESSQLGEVTVDLRLGYDFLVPILTRKPFISVVEKDQNFRGVESYYRSTRREIGDRFVLYPQQVVLTTSLEYVGLPADVYADLLPRSSYARLGMSFGTMMQPGYRGCFPLELSNTSNNPLELVVGSRIVQARFFNIEFPSEYNGQDEPRKYLGNTRPVVSKAAHDGDLFRLHAIALKRNT